MEIDTKYHVKAKKEVKPSAYRKLLKLAGEHGLLKDGRTNLDNHNSDSEDFLETSVWTLNDILQAAYQIGYADAERAIIRDLKKFGVHINETSKKAKK